MLTRFLTSLKNAVPGHVIIVEKADGGSQVTELFEKIDACSESCVGENL
jgi:hypothetical protein